MGCARWLSTPFGSQARTAGLANRPGGEDREGRALFLSREPKVRAHQEGPQPPRDFLHLRSSAFETILGGVGGLRPVGPGEASRGGFCARIMQQLIAGAKFPAKCVKNEIRSVGRGSARGARSQLSRFTCFGPLKA